MVLYRMFMSPRKIVSVRDEAYSRGSIRHQNRLLLLLLIVGLACWPFSVKVACFLSIVSVAFLGINFISCIMDDEDDFAFNANGLGSKYIFKSDIIEVPELDFSEYRVFNCLVCQDISRANQATKRANKSINQAVKRMQWGDIRDKVMWAQEEQRHLSTHAEEFACYLTDLIEAFSPDLSEPSNIIRTTLRNYADSLNEMADDIDKMFEARMRSVYKSLGARHCHSGIEGDTEDTMGESVTSGADTGTLWIEDDF